MNATRRCSRCDAPLSESACDPVCGACMLAAVMQADSSTLTITDESEAAALGSSPLVLNRELRRFGEYDLLEEVAHGGMGVVYRARHRQLDRIVALKMLLLGSFASAEAVTRFRREAQAAAGLRHPNIVTVHEVGEIEGQRFFSMDFVEGGTLADRLRNGPLPHRVAASYMVAVADAVAHAHEFGIVHRDLKPSNILIDPFEQPRVTDFGLAKRLDDDTDLTLTAQVLGTPNYVAPEMAAGRVADQRKADLFSLGAVLYECLTGRPPFLAPSLAETLAKIRETEPVAPRVLNPWIPRDLETICLKCLEKDPRRRYNGGRELAVELGRYLAGEPIHARPATLLERVWKWCGRQPALASAGATVFLLLLAISIVSVVSAWRVQGANQRTTEELKRALLASARSARSSTRAGHRFEALEAIRQAVQLNPSPQLRQELRDEAIAALALPDLRQRSRISSTNGMEMVLFLPSGSHYARIHRAGALQIFATATDTLYASVTNLPPLKTDPWSLAFNPTGTQLALLFEDETGGLLDIPSGRLLMKSRAPAKWPFFSENGQWVTFCEFPQHSEQGSEVVIYGTAQGRELRRFAVPAGADRARLSPGNRWLAVSSEAHESVLILDAETGEVHRSWKAGPIVRELAWHPDGNRVAGSLDNGVVFIWAVNEPGEPLTFRHHFNGVVTLNFSHSGEILASSSWDDAVCLSDPETGQLLVRQQDAAGFDLRFSEDDRFLSSYRWGGEMASLFEVACPSEVRNRRQPRRINGLGAYTGPGTELFLSFGRGSDLLACGDDAGAALYDLRSFRLLGRFPTLAVEGVCFDSETNIIVSGYFGLTRWGFSPPDTNGTRRVSKTGEMLGMGGLVGCARGSGLVVSAQDSRLTVLDAGTLSVRAQINSPLGRASSPLIRAGRWVVLVAWPMRSGTVRRLNWCLS